jgi:hypothetical protein
MKKGHEILITAIIGIILQAGLIAIAAVFPGRVGPKSSSGVVKYKVYGFPTYFGGSILLSIGTGLCSLIVEHTTDNYTWNVRNVKKAIAPRLLWLQQKQSVGDQSFNGYVISSGPKHRVITSSRREVPERHRESGKSKTGDEVSDESLRMAGEYNKPQLTSSGLLGGVDSYGCSFSWHWIYGSVHGPSWSSISMLNRPTWFYLHHGSSSGRYPKATRTSH